MQDYGEMKTFKHQETKAAQNPLFDCSVGVILGSTLNARIFFIALIYIAANLFTGFKLSVQTSMKF